MSNRKYGITKQAKPQFPVRELLTVPHSKDEDLTLGFPAFGPNNYQTNLKDIAKTYSHPLTEEQIKFKPATTSKSISAVAYDFENLAKPQIFNPRWLQAGYIIKTQDGVFTNTNEINESNLKQLLNGAKETNGIYLINNQIAFIPYESFKTGVQDVDTFAEGGLARGLEHVSGKIAPKLREIASSKFYKRGVNVWGFESTKKPVLKIASLNYNWGFGGGLVVGCDIWGDDDSGYAFGVCNSEKDK